MREWLRELRGDRTQKSVAIEAGIPQQLYNVIENGKRGASVAVAKKIAAVLDFDWTRFFEDNAETA